MRKYYTQDNRHTLSKLKVKSEPASPIRSHIKAERRELSFSRVGKRTITDADFRSSTFVHKKNEAFTIQGAYDNEADRQFNRSVNDKVGEFDKLEVTRNNDNGFRFKMNSLRGIFNNHGNFCENPEQATYWAGMMVPSKEDKSFNKQRTQMSEWQSACYNGGVYRNK